MDTADDLIFNTIPACILIRPNERNQTDMARSSGCERWVYSGSDTDNGGARAGISKHFGGLIQHGRACPLPPQMAAERDLPRGRAGDAGEKKAYRAADIAKAWSPFYILTAAITIWSLPAFKALFQEGGLLYQSTLLFKMPFLHQQIMKMPPIAPSAMPLDAVFKVDLLSATGTSILAAVIVTGLFSKNFSCRDAFASLKETGKELWVPIMTICFVMGFANLANFAGLSSSIGLALAKTGDLFPFVSPVLGWIGVFITGSVVSNNALFGHLQVVTGAQIGAGSDLLLAANTAGGVMAKLVSPQSIAIAAAAVGQTGKESKLFKRTVAYSLILLLIICIWTFILARLGV